MKRVLWMTGCLFTLALFAACADDQLGGDPFTNQAPTVWLSAAPPEGSTGSYTVEMFWGGWDPDGEVANYEYLITDNDGAVFDPADTVGVDWLPVYGNDSSFTFTADVPSATNPTDQVSEFQRSHTFFIRAVDEMGVRSEVPAYRSFTARTLSPEVRVLIPQRNGFTPADVPPISTFRWVATDYVNSAIEVQEPDSVQWAFVNSSVRGNDLNATLAYLRTSEADHEWYPWIWYQAPNDSGKFWTTAPQEFGTYIFAIRAKDEAGAVTPVLDELTNVRRVRVTRRTTGPIFTVNSPYTGNIVTSSCSHPLTILDMPAGVNIDFKLSATAAHYGGTVSGYRYGWDIADLSDPEQWEVDFTPFVGATATTPARRFFFGTHTFTAEVVDNSGYCARVEVKVNIVQFTLQRNLLIVDDFRTDETASAGFENAIGRGSVPSDAEHDAFWNDMASNVEGFDPLRDVLTTTSSGTIPLTTFADYKCIIWSASSDVAQQTNLPLLYRFIQFRPKDSSGAGSGSKVVPNLIALTMGAGGHVLITGAQPVQNVINRSTAPGVRYPLIFLYELMGAQTGTPNISNPVGDLSFAYQDLCLETIDFAIQSAQRRRTNSLYCPIVSLRIPNSTTTRNDTMREAVPLDPAFPSISLRPEVTGLNKYYAPTARGIDSEIYNARYFALSCQYVRDTPRSCFEPIWGHVCLDTAEPIYHQPVAFWTSVYADRVADGVPGAVAARSAVFGFPPVLFNPSEMKTAIEVILFDEWQLPRRASRTAMLHSD